MKKLLMAATLVVSSCATSPAYAEPQDQCSPLSGLEEGLSHLQEKFGEEPIATYQSSKGAKIIILANLETGTMTVLAVLPDKVCSVDAGADFKFTHAAGNMPKDGQDA